MEPDCESHSCPRDPLWNRAGEVLYAGVVDRIFGVPGGWNLRRSSADSARLLWLDPRPTATLLPSYYRHYYTHGSAAARHRRPALEWLYRGALSTLPYMRERERLERMYLGAGAGRRVLEIGCGDGSRLELLRRQGWQVTGQEVDEAAALRARAQGFEVLVGDVASIDLGREPFDAVVMNHVVEHLLEPASVLEHCRRLLGAAGVLVVTTPNLDSYGHQVFGQDWVSLDPPRHLQLFGLEALRSLVAGAGFARIEAWTTPARAEAVGRGSACIRSGRSPWDPDKTLAVHVAALLFQWRALWRHRQAPGCGEELVVRAWVN